MEKLKLSPLALSSTAVQFLLLAGIPSLLPGSQYDFMVSSVHFVLSGSRALQIAQNPQL